MSGIALILGPVVFQDFEAAAGIRFGGEQRVVVHKLPGGDRVIDAMGRDDADITLSGTFSGPDCTLRARMLDELRVGGNALPLTWDIFFYTVVIRDFQADYRNSYWIPYRLVCSVLRDEAAALVETALSLAGSVAADLAAAAGQALSGIDFSAAQVAIAAPGSATVGTASYSQAFNALSAAQSSSNARLPITGSALDAASAILGTTTNPLVGVTALGSATSAAGQLAGVAVARGYVGRAALNLANAST